MNDVTPQSSGMSARSNHQTVHNNVRFDCVLLQFSSMSPHKEVSLTSILLQISGGLQNQENFWPQSSGMSTRSNQRTVHKKVRLDSVLPQVNGVSAHKEVSLDSILLQISGGCRIKQKIKSSLVPRSKPTSVPTRCRLSHRSSSASASALAAELEASPSQHHQNQNSSLK